MVTSTVWFYHSLGHKIIEIKKNNFHRVVLGVRVANKGSCFYCKNCKVPFPPYNEIMRRCKWVFMPYTTKEGPDQSASPHSLISAFSIIRYILHYPKIL